MTLDEAIASLNDEHRHEFVLEPGQLEEWLRELRTVRRLLKEAVRMLNDGSCNKDCRQCENHKSCDYDNRFKWKYTAEVLKLIGEGGDPGD